MAYALRGAFQTATKDALLLLLLGNLNAVTRLRVALHFLRSNLALIYQPVVGQYVAK